LGHTRVLESGAGVEDAESGTGVDDDESGTGVDDDGMNCMISA
jgi:hypothetical protein